MSTEAAINVIETVKKKIEKYIDTNQNDKVKEYLLKLQTTSVTPELLHDTKIDIFVNRLASDTATSYYQIAKKLLEKWQNKIRLSKPTGSSKMKTSITTNKEVVEKKSTIKRKSLDDDVTHSNTLSESQSSDEYKVNARGQSSSSTKKRKVISLAEYTGSKKPVIPPTTVNTTSIAESNNSKLTDTQIKEIYAQFAANGEEFAAKAPVLAHDVNKKLTETDAIHSNRNEFVANGHASKSSTNDKPTANGDDFWNEISDDDDDDDFHSNKQPIAQPQTSKTNRLPSNIQSNTQQVKKSTIVSNKKAENHSIASAAASNTVSLEHFRPSTSKSFQPQPAVPPKKPSEAVSFLRAKHGRQAIYSGKRTARTSIPSLQDLCVESLKDNVDMSCRTYFNRLPLPIVKPIIDAANPEQLQSILYNNPDYVDDCEPLWEQFCARFFQGVERDECETFCELYWRKIEEKEERLQRITENARKKKAETIDMARQTKSLSARPLIRSQTPQSNKMARQVIGLPATKSLRGQAKVKKPAIPPLLKKTLQFYKGKP